jgi:hypothetical protein
VSAEHVGDLARIAAACGRSAAATRAQRQTARLHRSSMDLWDRLPRISWRARFVGCLVFGAGLALYAAQDARTTLAFGAHLLWTFPLLFAVSFGLALPRKPT